MSSPFLPSAQNPLKLYTDLVLSPNDQPLVIDEFARLGPKATIKQLTEMWLQSHIRIEWTIVKVDPLDFTDSITAASSNQRRTFRLGNFRSWDMAFAQEFYSKIADTTGTLLIIEGLRKREDIPFFWDVFDRTVIVKAPEIVPFNTQ